MGGLNWINGNANGWVNGYEDEVPRGIKITLDADNNPFDNADGYGNGKAERTVARVLIKLGIDTPPVVITTKIGHFAGTSEHAYQPAPIRHQCEQSLINL